ncbi:MutL C terminal dimerization domain-containing protein [Phlebopus sp. FC_14]|nr:MutL C terminal dimerization domain-containing protein [Phlebopus sp. FC_14]
MQATTRPQDVVDLTDDWDISPTLVGTETKGKETSISTELTQSGDLNDETGRAVTLHVDLVSIGSFYLDLYKHLSSSNTFHSPPAQHPIPASTSSSTLRSAVESANLENAAADSVASAALSRIISKSDFQHMQVVGQFNLGFIVVRKRTSLGYDGEEQSEMDDLFIVDQHAADEKWNFETLQEKTVIESQRLFRPQPLQLTAADEMLAAENVEILKRNGFEVSQMDESEHPSPEEESMSPRLHLVAQPVSKDTVFDMKGTYHFKDLEELIHLMQDRPAGTMVRCSKARAMFAMRACRRSVMIGKALDKSRMTNIVQHMGTMDQPWNCPHGRPTMRHLSDLTSFGRYNPPRRAIDWKAFGTDESEAED